MSDRPRQLEPTTTDLPRAQEHPLPSTSPPPTAPFEKYHPIAPLDAGGMGQVYEGVIKFPLGQTRNCALKSIRGDRIDPRSVAMFTHEAMISWDLTGHPNILNTRSFGYWADGRLFLALDKEGPCLHAVCEAFRDEFPRVRLIARHMLRALRHLERNGIIHSDISPANILLGRDGNAKLCDFGLARRAREPGKPAPLSPTNGLIGVRAYASPEVLFGQRPTYAADRYSLGAVLFELLVDKVPYGSGDIGVLLARVAEDRRYSLPDTIPADLTRLVNGLLEPDPDKRLTVAQGLAILRDSEEPKATKKDLETIASEWLAAEEEKTSSDAIPIPGDSVETPNLPANRADRILDPIDSTTPDEPIQERARDRLQRGYRSSARLASGEQTFQAPDRAAGREPRQARPEASRRTWKLVAVLAVLVAILIVFCALRPQPDRANPSSFEVTPEPTEAPLAAPQCLAAPSPAAPARAATKTTPGRVQPARNVGSRRARSTQQAAPRSRAQPPDERAAPRSGAQPPDERKNNSWRPSIRVWNTVRGEAVQGEGSEGSKP